jgi:uncharacterized protein (TIGR02453 family)
MTERREHTMAFTGFPPDGLAFLAGLAAHNERAWFVAHKQAYQATLLAPAQAFVGALGERLQALAPGIRVDPRSDGRGTLMRLSRDTRFSDDKTPYKTELSGLFWEGGDEKTACPAFGFRLQADGMDLMAGLFTFAKDALQAFRTAVADEQQGAELATIIDSLRVKAGYAVQGAYYKRVPAGYDPNHPRADLLRYQGLYVHPPRLGVDVVCSATLVDRCFEHFQAMAPVQRWLVKVLQPVALSADSRVV